MCGAIFNREKITKTHSNTHSHMHWGGAERRREKEYYEIEAPNALAQRYTCFNVYLFGREPIKYQSHGKLAVDVLSM